MRLYGIFPQCAMVPHKRVRVFQRLINQPRCGSKRKYKTLPHSPVCPIHKHSDEADQGHAEFVASLASLGPVAWVRLNEDEVRFTIIPEQGTQVWA
jgi:hypothetical protein